MTTVQYRPLITVVTPVLNGARYLSQCLDSVLGQNYEQTEHILVDGGSTDGTIDIIGKYEKQYSDRVKLVSVLNSSIAEAWNVGLQTGKGDIFGELGSDDFYEPGAFQVVVNFFRSHPDAFFVFGGCNQVNGDGKLIGPAISRDFDLREAIREAHYINCPSAFYRRELIKTVGLMDVRFPYAHDLDYWIRAGKVFTLYRIDTALANFRLHQGSIGCNPRADQVYAWEGSRISRKHRGGLFGGRARRYYLGILRPVWPEIHFILCLGAKVKGLWCRLYL